MNARLSYSSMEQSIPVFQIQAAQSDCLDVFSAEDLQASSHQKQRVRDKLLEVLLTLDVSAFEQCIAQLLPALGYQEIRVMRCFSPTRTSHKGRNQHGGFDLSASQATFTPSLTLVQVKQYSRPVSRRFVDELRGAMLRHGAPQGLLITTSTFPTNAQFSAQENQLLPIRLIDGEKLVDLLVHYRIGIRCKERINKKGKRRLVWRLERQFFCDLQRMT